MRTIAFQSSAGQALVIAGFCLLAPINSTAALVSWNVDAANSYVRLTFPDQTINVTNIGNITVRMRDPSNNNEWTDAGGRRAVLAGTIQTEYSDSASITFLGGSHDLSALEQVSLRPDPAQWDPATTNYVGSGTSPAALGARVRGTYTFFTFDIAFMALRATRFDLLSGVVPLTGGTIAANQTRFGIASARGDIDGLELPLGLGQPVPDVLNGQMATMVETNSAIGTIQNLGGRERKLTYNIATPVLLQLDNTVLSGSAAGVIVAYAILPEPPTLRIFRYSINSVVLAWPASATGFVLESKSPLSSSDWVQVSIIPTVVGTERQVTLPLSAGPVFYRLRSQ